MEKLKLSDSISHLPGVGKVRETELNTLGIFTLSDLLYYPPFRYETVEKSVTISELKADTTANFKAQVVSKIPIQSRRFRSMIKIKVSDATGSITLTWFNTPFILTSVAVGQEYYFTGKVSEYKGKLNITNPTVEKNAPDYGSMIPIYHESADINSRFLRKLIQSAIEITDLSDDPKMIPTYERLNLISREAAIRQLHSQDGNRDRLAFDEMFALIMGVIKRRTKHRESVPVAKFSSSEAQIEEFSKLLPYPLTPSQHEAIKNIAADLSKPHPMRRLLQGEVGSGKTTVAAFALWVSAKQKGPAIIICPTKILAEQHFETLSRIFKQSLKVKLINAKEKATDADILVGTHALFNIKGLKPTLVVIDEEHRFGVAQRDTFFKLKKKPHFLSMTATPIPRTVALTALADQEVSYISPHKSSDNIKTWVVPEDKRGSAHAWIAKTIQETGGQLIYVCPFIEVSYIETLAAVKSAKQEFENLKKVFAKFKLELLHGKIKEDEKSQVFEKMMAGKTDILVTTPVVEVGVDIPKANIIVIEGAERYGLAQLHQLRGRVGRRGQEAFCLLFTTKETDSTKRLEHFAKTYDGNALAEYDLKHRGSGELLGSAQHGFDTLKFASWFDTKLIETCRAEAEKF